MAKYVRLDVDTSDKDTSEEYVNTLTSYFEEAGLELTDEYSLSASSTFTYDAEDLNLGDFLADIQDKFETIKSIDYDSDEEDIEEYVKISA